ncbi:LuxR C-terminal-related transcriptional regulator [Paenibacillus cymbidii]|uniref:LuxR C-terminal-related transcriptional regulator n=1 Tax=Paenibacillus cymbidii TaxID=1639034 RepID=UPI0010804DF7|nr:LuxR C-terminal-related transcriptional regulator [Paenibacillus cymbidii]
MLTAELAPALKGNLPCTLLTVSRDGMPNIINLSRVWPIDADHIAAANQFFNKTAANLGENPHALLRLADPNDLLHWELELRYSHAETEGPRFDSIRHELQTAYWMAGLPDEAPLRAVAVFQVIALRKCLEEADHLLPASELYGDLLAALADAHGWRRMTYWIAGKGETPMRLAASRGVPGAGTDQTAFEPMRRLSALIEAEPRVVRLHHMREQVKYVQTIRTHDRPVPGPPEGGEATVPAPPTRGSYLGIPVRAYGSFVGIVCCESEEDEPEAFESYDDRYLQLLSRKLGEAVFAAAAVPERDRKPLLGQLLVRARLEWERMNEPFFTALSPRERQVAICAAGGSTNAQIAETLYISKRTVTTHMERIFLKLQIASRAALTRYIVEKELAAEADDEPRR